jgi:hypothetical protein
MNSQGVLIYASDYQTLESVAKTKGMSVEKYFALFLQKVLTEKPAGGNHLGNIRTTYGKSAERGQKADRRLPREAPTGTAQSRGKAARDHGG